ncbi:FAD/NAD(P)-binding domain-containing protein [Daldinia sp. FL1419]|nr:FAD/NAD(P)-binding domain-containing protein [Daldinia sp. FL1419]
MGTSSPSTSEGPFNVKKIAVIGAGPSGLAAAKYLLAQEGAFPRIDVFEQQAEVGGVWNYSAVTGPAEALPVPQTDAHPKKPDPPVLVPGKDGDEMVPLFPSPMYDDLHTNIPHTLMKYSDLPFPGGCNIYPTRAVVQEYLVEYSKEVRHLIKFSTQVTLVTQAQKSKDHPREREQWDVSTTNLLTGKQTTETYDAVVAASGHYSTPYIPDSIEGISDFHARHPGIISHSKLYRNAEPFRGKKVVVVGTGASGLDIAAQIQRVSKTPLLLSAQTAAAPGMLEHIGKVVQVGQIKKFLIEERGVEFFPFAEDENSDDEKKTEGETRTETDIDAILFCTGYLYTFPFLPSLPLITTGRKVHGLAKHFLSIAHPTLAFPGLPMKVIPFPLSESQGAVLARLWSNTLPLPPVSTLEQWEREDGEGTSEGKYHVFPKGGDGRYINGLWEWLRKESAGGGKEPPRWDAEMLWQRGIYAEAKMQFEKTGKKAKTLEELGFKYIPEEVDVKKAEDVEGKDLHLDVAG